MRKRIYTFVAIAFILFQATAQTDTLLVRINAMKDDTGKFMFVYRQGLKVKKADPEKTSELVDLLASLRKKINFRKGDIAFYHLKGELMEVRGLTDSALYYYNASLNLAKELKDNVAVAKRYLSVAIILQTEGNLAGAIDLCMKSLKINEETGNKLGTAYAMIHIGNLFHVQRNIEKAESYFKDALALSLEEKDANGMASCYNNLGMVNNDRKNYKIAQEYYLKALKLKQEMNDLRGVANCYDRLAQSASNLGNNAGAIDYWKKAIEIQEKMGFKEGIATTCVNIGFAYQGEKKLKEAEKMYKRSEAIADELKHVELRRYIYGVMAQLYNAMGRYKEAYEYYSNFTFLNDSLLNKESSKQVAEMEAKYETEKKALLIKNMKNEQALQDAELKNKNAEIKKQNTRIIAFAIGFLLMLAASLIIYRNYRQKKKANLVIAKQKAQVELQRDLMEKQKHIIEEKNTEIMDSIHYARRIQRTLLAQKDIMDRYLQEYFIFFQPKDVVSGDFYWAAEVSGSNNVAGNPSATFFLAACDCTGHGVPGAFMSLLNISFLNEAIKEKNMLNPAEVFNHVRKKLIENISQDGGKDGMDGILICIEKEAEGIAKNKVTYAAAYNTPVLVRENQLILLEADKMPVGQGEKDDSFTLYTQDVQKGDVLYLYTDGFADQFGGPKGKKFRYKALNETLREMFQVPCAEQHKKLDEVFSGWKGNLEQIDDVCIIGLRI
jgi:serine phosphatase RsbU (regulator of sigma subunit)